MAKKQQEEWAKYLTSARREHFESVGVESVQFDVSNHNYREQEKTYAALVWLGEKRRAIEHRDKIILGVGLATLLVAFATLMVAAI